VKIFMPAGAAEPVYAPYREQLPPDPSSAIFWLKNRRPEEWRDKVVSELTGKDGGPIEVQSKMDFSDLAPDERKDFKALLKKIAARKAGNL
jgi:hypothetical protein